MKDKMPNKSKWNLVTPSGLYCGECSQFECARMKEFYSKPGYDKLRRRMLEEVAKRKREL